MKDTKVLLCGYPKTGNHWCRFIVFNYYNIKNFGATKTLTFNELYKINYQKLEIIEQVASIPNYLKIKEGFPFFIRTNSAGLALKYKDKYYDKIVYVYRNPYDTMVSYWNYSQNNRNRSKKLTLEEFCKKNISAWLADVRMMYPIADVKISYDEARRNPGVFRYIIDLFEDEIDEIILKKAIKMSSFESVKEMSMLEHQEGGHTLNEEQYDNDFMGIFCRDGRSGQYLKWMDSSLMKWIKNYIVDVVETCVFPLKIF